MEDDFYEEREKLYNVERTPIKTVILAQIWLAFVILLTLVRIIAH